MKLVRRHATPEAREFRSLEDLPLDCVARVGSLVWDAPSSARRLTELGLTPGATFVVLNRTPTAVVVATRGGRVAIGLDLASGVLVDAATVQCA